MRSAAELAATAKKAATSTTEQAIAPLIAAIVAAAWPGLAAVELAVQSQERAEQPEALDEAEAEVHTSPVGRTGSILEPFWGRV